MRNAVVGALVVAGLWVAVAPWSPGRENAVAGQIVGDVGGSPLVTWSVPAGEGRQLLCVVDQRTQALATYGVDVTSGSVTLKSVRNLRWDLQMTEYNGVSPLPGELRRLSEQR